MFLQCENFQQLDDPIIETGILGHELFAQFVESVDDAQLARVARGEIRRHGVGGILEPLRIAAKIIALAACPHIVDRVASQVRVEKRALHRLTAAALGTIYPVKFTANNSFTDRRCATGVDAAREIGRNGIAAWACHGGWMVNRHYTSPFL